jgi:hypothetical protein
MKLIRPDNKLIPPTYPKKIDQVICVCCQRDAEVWKIASKYIIKNIDSKSYKVIVPENEANFFKKISHEPFEVLSESIYKKRFGSEIKKRLSKKISTQYGWYLQQFIKLAAAEHYDSDKIILIWDADTIPLKNLVFINNLGQLNYYKAIEYHKPYFETIKRLLQLTKKVKFSFIAQCFVFKTSWLHEFLYEIEKIHGKSWDIALLDSINFEEGNSFSEYETLGTFISQRYADEINFLNDEWLRLGNSKIGHPVFLNQKMIERKLYQYDFICFEKWDRAKPYFWKVSLPYFFKIYLPILVSKYIKLRE